MSQARRYLNLKMGVGRDLSLRIVERPGLALTPAALDALIADLRTVARTVLPDGDLSKSQFRIVASNGTSTAASKPVKLRRPSPAWRRR